MNIMVEDTLPPGVTPGGPNEYRAASGEYTFSCTATGGPGGGDYEYMWTSTCQQSTCPFQTSSTGATSVIMRQALHSGDDGTHTCAATRGGLSGSDSINITIVGEYEVGIDACLYSTCAYSNSRTVQQKGVNRDQVQSLCLNRAVLEYLLECSLGLDHHQ